jgi:hypothetical protein
MRPELETPPSHNVNLPPAGLHDDRIRIRIWTRFPAALAGSDSVIGKKQPSFPLR